MSGHVTSDGASNTYPTTRDLAARAEARCLLAEGAARVARTLQAKGYLVLVHPGSDLYLAGKDGPEPAFELIVINPHDGQRSPLLAVAHGLDKLQAAAEAMPPPGLRIVVPGGTAH